MDKKKWQLAIVIGLFGTALIAFTYSGYKEYSDNKNLTNEGVKTKGWVIDRYEMQKTRKGLRTSSYYININFKAFRNDNSSEIKEKELKVEFSTYLKYIKGDSIEITYLKSDWDVVRPDVEFYKQ